MDLICYKYSLEGEEVLPSVRENRENMEKLRTEFWEALLCPQSYEDALVSLAVGTAQILPHPSIAGSAPERASPAPKP